MAFKIYASNFAFFKLSTRDANIQKQSQRIHLFEKAFPHLGQVFLFTWKTWAQVNKQTPSKAPSSSI